MPCVVPGGFSAPLRRPPLDLVAGRARPAEAQTKSRVSGGRAGLKLAHQSDGG
jgi:hypothetical protein